jgi:PEP-CTERM motif
VRHARSLAVACLPFFIAASAGARPATDSNSLSKDLLRIWNQDDPTVDVQSPQAVPQRYDLYLLSSPDYLGKQQEQQPTTEPAPVGFTAPDGTSLTPHIDRLMRQVSGLPASPEVVTPFSPSSSSSSASATTDGSISKAGGNTQIEGHRRRNYTQPGCPSPAPTPEPGTLLLLGAAAIALRPRRRT